MPNLEGRSLTELNNKKTRTREKGSLNKTLFVL